MEAQIQPTPAPFPEIPGYRIEAVLGRGSAGVVYRAVQLAVERKVAIKVLHPELASRGRAVRRLQREARTTARLAHPGIVTAIDMGNSGGLWWYAMELVEGTSLAEKLKRDGPMSERDVVRLFIPLCEALEHAFEQGVVHRDLKPGNILIDGTGRARIVDLGLALNEDDPTITAQGGTLGTPHYISPEQAKNPKNADVRSDIWSLGATMFHCLCGRPPFAGTSVAEILSGVLYAPIPDPTEFAPHLSKSLALVLRKCLIRDSARRYQHPREVREDLERIRERRTVSVRRNTLDPLAGEADRRARRLRIAGACAVIALVIAAFVWKPWRSWGGGQTSVVRIEPYEPLEALASRINNPDARIAPTLEQLEDLRFSIPAENQARADEVRLALSTRYEQELAAAHETFKADLRRLWKEHRDFAGALELIDHGLATRLRERLGLSARQLAELDTRFKLSDTRRQIDDDRRVELGILQQRLARHFTEIIARDHVQPKLAAGRWRAALAALEIPAATVIADAGIPTTGFAPGDLEAVAAALESEVIRRAADDLKARWRTEDHRRAVELLQRRSSLIEDVELGKIMDVDQELDALYEAGLKTWNVQPDEILASESDEFRRRRDEIRAELAPIAELVRLRLAESLLEDRTAGLDERWRAREFGSIAREFAELAANPTFAPVRERVERIAEQGRVLEEVLQRAAREIERLSTSREEFALMVGNLQFVGRVEEGQQVFEKGFRFRPSKVSAAGVVPSLLALRELRGGKATLVGRAALERFAGFASPTLDADRRFELALLRWHLGDRVEAAAVRIETPTVERWVPLAAELASWIAGLDEARRVESLQRVERARLNLAKVRTAATSDAADPRLQAAWIDELLTQYLDLDFVASRAQWLKERRDELRRSIELDTQARFRRDFGPTELEFPEPQTVRMHYEFGAQYSGPFQRGDWSADLDGWIPTSHNREQLTDERLWPTLELASPLSLDEALELVVVFEQPARSGQSKLFSISVAGVHVVFLGPSMLNQKGRWRVGTGSADGFRQVLEDLHEGKKGAEFEPFQGGVRYTIRIELKEARGDVEIYINNKFVGRDKPVRPDSGASTDRSLVFRSLEPVRLVSATLRARYR